MNLELNLSPDFKRKYDEWQKMKLDSSAQVGVPLTCNPPPPPPQQQQQLPPPQQQQVQPLENGKKM